MCYVFFFYVSGAHRDLHVLTHAFPTRRSSDLAPTIGDRLGSSLGRFDEERGTLLFHRHALEADFGRADQPPAGGDGDRDRDMAVERALAPLVARAAVGGQDHCTDREERPVGEECVSTVRFRWCPYT